MHEEPFKNVDKVTDSKRLVFDLLYTVSYEFFAYFYELWVIQNIIFDNICSLIWGKFPYC